MRPGLHPIAFLVLGDRLLAVFLRLADRLGPLGRIGRLDLLGWSPLLPGPAIHLRQLPGVLGDVHLGLERHHHVDAVLLLDPPDRFPIDESPIHQQGLHHPATHGFHESIHQGDHGLDLVAFPPEHPRPRVQEEVLLPVRMGKRGHLAVPAEAAQLLPARRKLLPFLLADLVVVLVKPAALRALVVLVVGDEEVGAVEDEDPLGIVGTLVLEVPGRIRPVPGLQTIGVRIPGELPHEVLVARRPPVVGVLVVVALVCPLISSSSRPGRPGCFAGRAGRRRGPAPPSSGPPSLAPCTSAGIPSAWRGRSRAAPIRPGR
jgi:hypothetical protein